MQDGRELSPPGLVWAMRGVGGGPAEEAPEGAAVARPDSGWLWLHFNLADSRARSHIQSRSDIPGEAKSLLCESDEFQQIHADGAFTYGMVADLCLDISGPTEGFGFLRFVVGEGLVMTARRCPLQAVDATRRAIAGHLRVPTDVALMGLLLDRLVDGFDDLAARLAVDVDQTEDKILDGSAADERRALGRVRRTSVHLHRHIAGLRMVLLRLERGGRGHPVPLEVMDALQAIAPRIDQLDRELVALRERARLLQEEIASLLAEETNRHLRVLSILTILFLPPTFVAGLFGMNLKGMAFSESESGFWWGTIMAVASAAMVVWIMRRMGVLGGSAEG
jgi:zinc transporter